MLYLLSSSGKDSKTEAVPPCPVSLVPEEKVSFSFYALSVSSLTVAKIRKAYNKIDSKAIAKQVRTTFLFSARLCVEYNFFFNPDTSDNQI